VTIFYFYKRKGGILMENLALKKSVLTASFVALAIVVGFIQIPWPPAPFLSIDFSEVIILACLITLGFKLASVTIVLRSVVRLLVGLTTTAAMDLPYFGEVMAIIASFTLIIAYVIITRLTRTAHKPLIIYKEEKPEKYPFIRNLINVGFVVVTFTVVMVLFNYFFAIPINTSGGKHLFVVSYVNAFFDGNFWGYTTFLIPIVLPFNLVKGIVTMIVFELIHFRLRLMEINSQPANIS